MWPSHSVTAPSPPSPPGFPPLPTSFPCHPPSRMILTSVSYFIRTPSVTLQQQQCKKDSVSIGNSPPIERKGASGCKQT